MPFFLIFRYHYYYCIPYSMHLFLHQSSDSKCFVFVSFFILFSLRITSAISLYLRYKSKIVRKKITTKKKPVVQFLSFRSLCHRLLNIVWIIFVSCFDASQIVCALFISHQIATDNYIHWRLTIDANMMPLGCYYWVIQFLVLLTITWHIWHIRHSFFSYSIILRTSLARLCLFQHSIYAVLGN